MKLTYRPEIDGLRAVAVGAVIIYHAQINILGYHLFEGGFIGVDIFFVISGYLITSIIFKELVETGSFSFKYFYERRIRRILPALLTVILVSLPFAWFYLMPSSLVEFSKSILYSLGFSSNFYFHYSGQQYATESALLKPFLHTWSLSVEEQYYILFPIFLLFIFKFFRKYLIQILIIGFILSIGLAQWGSKSYPSLTFYTLPTRGWELIAGSVLAYFEVKWGHRCINRKLNLILPSIGLILLGYSFLFFNDKMNHPSFYTLSPILGTCLIIWFSHGDEIITKILSTKLFVGIGLISYSLYLWHYPIFAFYRYTFAQGSILAEIFIILLLFIISFLTYFFIENKFRDKNFNFLKIFYFLFSLIFLIIFINSFFIFKKGFPKRAIIDGISIDKNYYLKEISEWEQRNKIDLRNIAQKKIITIVGDSHASNFALLFQTNPEIFPNYVFIPLSIDDYKIILEEKNKNSEENMLISKSDIVIFSFFYDDNEFNQVREMIKFIKKNTNKKIVLTTNNPIFNLYGSRFTDLDFFMIKHKIKPNKKQLIELEKNYYLFLKNNTNYNQINKKLAKLSKNNNIKLLDKSFYQCDHLKKRCDVLTNDYKKINWDSDHHTLYGAKYLGNKIYTSNWFLID